MELIINDMPQYGVLIHGPESPGFRERLLSLFRDSPFGAPPELDDGELPCSFIVENQTPSHIVTAIDSTYEHSSPIPDQRSTECARRSRRLSRLCDAKQCAIDAHNCRRAAHVLKTALTIEDGSGLRINASPVI